MLSLPAYSIGDVAHYLQLPIATVRSWVLGRPYQTQSGERRFQPVIAIADRKEKLLSFQNVVEVHVLSAIRRQHEVQLSAVRRAVGYIKKSFEVGHPLADVTMLTDGTDLFVERYGQLINASSAGQVELAEALKQHLKRVERTPKGIPIRLYPFTTSRRNDDAQRPVAIDPMVQYGRPCIAGTGIPTAIIGERWKAGESISELAADYRRTGIEN